MANRSELSNTFQRVEGMIQYVRENLDDEEYCVFLDMVAPLPEPQQSTKKAGRKSSKKSSKSASKSSRASGMAAAISSNLQAQREAAKSDDNDDGFCAACHVQIGHNVHHLESLPGYHPFQSKSDAVAHEAGAGG